MEEKESASITVVEKQYYSIYLEREVLIDIYKPVDVTDKSNARLLLINDGQDLRKMNFQSIVDPLVSDGIIEPVICVGIHCGFDRLN